MVKFQALGEEKAIKDPVLKTPPSVDTSVYGGFRLVVWLKSGLEWAARLGLLFSTLGLAVALRLPVRGWQMVAAPLSLDFDSPATRPTPFDALNSPFPFFPLFLLLIWLIAALVLLFKELPAPVSSVSTSQIPNPKIQKVNREKRLRWLLFGLTLIVLLIVGWAQRSAQLLPDSLGRFPQPNYDEMVYYSSAAAFAAGHLPYRDFFTAHPPGTFALFAAFFKLFGLQAGGPDTFLAGRWFSVIQGLLTVVGTFWAAGRLWATLQKGAFALGAAFIAGLLYALDGRASEIAMLENVSNLVAIVGFSCFLEGERAARGRRWHWLVTAGGLASAAALTKLPGIALIFALLVYLFYRRDWRGLGLTLTGAGLGFLLIEGPFIGLAGLGEVLRQQVFFQMLRPQEVRSGLDEVARIAGYPEASLTVFLGGLGFCLLAWLVVRRPEPMLAHLLLPALWSVPLLVIFIFSKSFHPWYYVQWALPLALLAGGLGAVLRPVYRVGLLGLLVLTFPLLLSEWQAERKVDYDRVYGPVANFIQSQPSGATALFALDPGYNLMAGLPSARLPSGKYLID
ncbi:MAG: glycosyltransferase family 39 protein, partial [Chloroflexota bacterium]